MKDIELLLTKLINDKEMYNLQFERLINDMGMDIKIKIDKMDKVLSDMVLANNKINLLMEVIPGEESDTEE